MLLMLLMLAMLARSNVIRGCGHAGGDAEPRPVGAADPVAGRQPLQVRRRVHRPAGRVGRLAAPVVVPDVRRPPHHRCAPFPFSLLFAPHLVTRPILYLIHRWFDRWRFSLIRDRYVSLFLNFVVVLARTGSKEVSTYGVDAYTGLVRYECTKDGCRGEPASASSASAAPMLVVRRLAKTVRAIEPRTGMERWNFSVGQHEATLLHASPSG